MTYIALEGIKGTGKTTIMHRIMKSDIAHKLTCFPITAPLPPHDQIEKLFKGKPKLQENDAFIEQLFLHRALVHHQNAIQTSRHLLGDRSILTAIVTRWEKWNDPTFTIQRVLEQYKQIQKPNVYILLENPIEKSIENIATRIAKPTGSKDEKEDILIRANEIYRTLLTEGEYSSKIGKAEIIRLDTNNDLNNISAEILEIIKHYIKK